MQKVESPSFIQAVIAVCASCEIFNSLKQQKIWRTLLHFSFLAFICSCFIMLAGHEHMLNEIDKPLDAFENSAGGIVFKGGAYYPAKDPEKPYEIMLAPKFKLVYSPDFETFRSDWINKDGTTFLWFPRFWCITMTSSAHSSMHVFSGFPNSALQEKQDIDDRDDLMEYLRKCSIEAKEKTFNPDTRTFNVSRIEFERMYLGILFFYYWFEFMIQALIMTALFSIFYRFVGTRSGSMLKFREIFCSGLYSAMPPMIVASFFPALDLPYFNFGMVFTAGYLIYFIFVLNHLEKTAADNDQTNL